MKVLLVFSLSLRHPAFSDKKCRSILMRDPKAFYLRIVLSPLLLVSILACVTGPVVKMPESLPSSIKSYKHFTLWAGSPGMKGTGVQLNRGDTYTVLATGSIDFFKVVGC